MSDSFVNDNDSLSSPFMDHILNIMAKASVGDLSARVIIPETLSHTSLTYKLVSALNILLNDLQRSQEERLRDVAEKALVKSKEIQHVARQVIESIDKTNK